MEEMTQSLSVQSHWTYPVMQTECGSLEVVAVSDTERNAKTLPFSVWISKKWPWTEMAAPTGSDAVERPYFCGRVQAVHSFDCVHCTVSGGVSVFGADGVVHQFH